MPRQTSIPGTDVDNPVIADLIERWLEAVERAKAAREKAGEADDAIVIKMQELSISYHPYIDPETGKRKYRVVDTTPRGKSVAARPVPSEDMEPDEPELSESEPTPVERTEHRKVPRAKAQREIAERDASVRAADNGQAADVGEFRAAKNWDEDEAEL